MKFVAFLAIAFLLAVHPCAATCLSWICDAGQQPVQSAPSCHQHQSNKIPASCGHKLTTSPAGSPQAVQAEAPVFATVIEAIAPERFQIERAFLPSIRVAPPDPHDLSSIVLRI